MEGVVLSLCLRKRLRIAEHPENTHKKCPCLFAPEKQPPVSFIGNFQSCIQACLEKAKTATN